MRFLLKAFLPICLLLILTKQACLHNQFYNTASFQCVNCQNGCDQCSNSANNCTACIPNFYLTNSSCLACPQECYSCTSPSNCTACKENFYLSNYSCLSCSKNCMICNSSSCKVCQVGYNIETNCLTCAKQFYSNSAKNTCELCTLGCLECTSRANCSKCIKNYQLNDDACDFSGSSKDSEGSEDSETTQTDRDEHTQGSNQTQSSNKNIFFIILGVIVGVTAISIISCFAYYCWTRKNKKINKNLSQQPKLINKASTNTTFNIDKESVINHESMKCQVCKLGNPQIERSCGHYFHRNCFEKQQRKCPACFDEISVADTYFNEANHKEGQSDFEQSVKPESDDITRQKKKRMIEMESLK